MINKDLYRRYRFFKASAGYCVGLRAVGALQLARAEIWAEEQELTFVWDGDIGGELGDHEEWCSDARRSAAGYGWQGEKLSRSYLRDNGCSHEVSCCLCEDQDDNVLASFGGIIDADSTYRRVVEAELALEAMRHEADCKNIMAL